MSYVKLERRPPTWWRGQAETADQMLAKHWDVTSRCSTCHLVMRTNLAVITMVSGGETSLWNRRQRCRRMHCVGFVTFSARPPELMQPFALMSAWPEDREPGWWRKPHGARR